MVQYMVELKVFHWDYGHYTVEYKHFIFPTMERASEFYSRIMEYSYDGDMYGDSYCPVHHHKNESLSELVGIDHGGIYEHFIELNKITTERIK